MIFTDEKFIDEIIDLAGERYKKLFENLVTEFTQLEYELENEYNGAAEDKIKSYRKKLFDIAENLEKNEPVKARKNLKDLATKELHFPNLSNNLDLSDCDNLLQLRFAELYKETRIHRIEHSKEVLINKQKSINQKRIEKYIDEIFDLTTEIGNAYLEERDLATNNPKKYFSQITYKRHVKPLVNMITEINNALAQTNHQEAEKYFYKAKDALNSKNKKLFQDAIKKDIIKATTYKQLWKKTLNLSRYSKAIEYNNTK